MVKRPTWVANVPFTRINSVSTDGGKTYALQKDIKYVGSYYFLGKEMAIHERKLSSIVALLIDIGGLMKSVTVIMTVIIGAVN